nr:hypothetical protein CFP56_29848 [Quercus suber]
MFSLLRDEVPPRCDAGQEEGSAGGRGWWDGVAKEVFSRTPKWSGGDRRAIRWYLERQCRLAEGSPAGRGSAGRRAKGGVGWLRFRSDRVRDRGRAGVARSVRVRGAVGSRGEQRKRWMDGWLWRSTVLGDGRVVRRMGKGRGRRAAHPCCQSHVQGWNPSIMIMMMVE